MTRSMQISNRDLALFGGSVQMVTGREKLEQDLSIWLTERYGIDRFHTRYGSILDYYIGQVIDDDTALEIRNEVLRVLTNFQALQVEALRNNPGVFTPEELLDRIIAVDVEQAYDALNVRITYSSLTGDIEVLTVGRDVQ